MSFSYEKFTQTIYTVHKLKTRSHEHFSADDHGTATATYLRSL